MDLTMYSTVKKAFVVILRDYCNKENRESIITVLILGFLIFSIEASVSVYTPVLPFIIHDFFPELTPEQIGVKAGYLALVYYAGNAVGNIVWSWISDAAGRRNILLVGTFNCIVYQLSFAFSQNFQWAVASRLLWGLMHGNYAVSKTYVAEAVDESHQSRGFIAISIGSGVGRICGTVLGGFLSHPAIKYTAFQSSFFCEFPYSLPYFFTVCIAMFSFIATAFLEDKKSCHCGKKASTKRILLDEYNRDNEQTIVSAQKTDDLFSEPKDMQKRKSQHYCEWESRLIDWLICTPLWDFCLDPAESDVIKLSGFSYLDKHEEKERKRCERRRLINILKGRFRTIWRKLKYLFTPTVLLVLTFSFVQGLLLMIVFEIFPLLMVTPYGSGGYSLDDNEIEVFIFSAAITEFFFLLFIYPHIVKGLGLRWSLRLFLIAFAISCFILPFSNQITGPIENSKSVLLNGTSTADQEFDFCGAPLNSSLLSLNEDSVKRIPPSVWATVGITNTLGVLSRISASTVLVVMLSNSATPKTRSTINGLGSCGNNIAFAIGPLLGTQAFSWSLQNGLGPPLNYHFVYNLMTVLTLVLLVGSFAFPKSIQRRREDSDHGDSKQEENQSLLKDSQ